MRIVPLWLYRRLTHLHDSFWPAQTVGEPNNSVYLTFDDGPASPFTMQMAGLLESRGYRGTFFCTGEQASRHPDVLLELVKAGHSVGSHSLTHPQGWLESPLNTFKDYWRGYHTINRILGYRVRLFRPPYGHHNFASRLFSRVSRCKVVLWTCDSEDWRPEVTSDNIVATVDPFIKNGSIILMHDWIVDNQLARDRTVCVEALSRILDIVESRNLTAEAIRES